MLERAFDAAYKKAGETSQPHDWMEAALIAQQLRHARRSAIAAPVPCYAGKFVCTVCEQDEAAHQDLMARSHERPRSPEFYERWDKAFPSSELPHTAAQQERPLDTNGGRETGQMRPQSECHAARGEAPRVPAAPAVSSVEAPVEPGNTSTTREGSAEASGKPGTEARHETVSFETMLKDAAPRSSTRQSDSTCWLVERPGPEWLSLIGPAPAWTKDAHEAIRYKTRKAANELIGDPRPTRRLPGFEQAFASEHVFIRRDDSWIGGVKNCEHHAAVSATPRNMALVCATCRFPVPESGERFCDVGDACPHIRRADGGGA